MWWIDLELSTWPEGNPWRQVIPFIPFDKVQPSQILSIPVVFYLSKIYNFLSCSEDHRVVMLVLQTRCAEFESLSEYMPR